MSIGQRIKERRKQLGINADTLAERSGVSRSTIFRWEKGEIEKNDAHILNRIAEALHTTSEYLYGLTDDPNQTYPSFQTKEGNIVILNTNEARILAAGFDKMPESERKRAIEMAKLIFSAYADLFEQKGMNEDDA